MEITYLNPLNYHVCGNMLEKAISDWKAAKHLREDLHCVSKNAPTLKRYSSKL